MEKFWMIVALISGPLIGALIGFVTNYIAIKMMFRPYREVYIGKWRLPFTPGIIPRRKAALASALGQMVSESLVAEADLKNALLSDKMTETVVGGILALPPLRQSGEALVGETYDIQRERILDALTTRVANGIGNMNLTEIITKEGVAAIGAMSPRNPLIAMFLNEATVASMAGPLADRLVEYVKGDGRERIYDLLEAELSRLEEKPLGSMLGDPEQMRPILTGFYKKLVSDHADALAGHFQIADIVAEKVNAMRPEDLEKLILQVMKKELNAVINLGGIIGFILGVANLLLDLI